MVRQSAEVENNMNSVERIVRALFSYRIRALMPSP